jgi:hypothetical protein
MILAILAASLLGGTASADKVSKEQFLIQLPTAVSVAFCDKDQPFRKCTTLTDNECLDLARLTVKACIKDVEDKMPTTMNQPEDGRTWGSKIGACAGSQFVRVLKTNKPDRVDLACFKQAEDAARAAQKK